MTYYIGQHQQALKHYEQALVIHREVDDRRGEGIDMNNLGIVYRTLEQYQQALEYDHRALEVSREIGDRLGEGNALGNLGSIYGDMGQYKRALKYYEQALAIRRKIGDRRHEGADLKNLGVIYGNIGQYQQAIATFQYSLKILGDLDAKADFWDVQSGIASIQAKLNQPDSAITQYEQALDTIEQLRAGLTEKEDKLSFMQNKLYVYDELISLLQDLHQKHPDKGYDRKALEIFERKQGRMFLEEMGQSGARNFAGIPAELLDKELDLENQLEQTCKQLVDHRSKPITEQNKELLQELEQRETTLQAEQTALQAQIKTDYPDYYALRYPKPVTLTDLQQKVLQPGEFLLIYHVMKDATLLWS